MFDIWAFLIQTLTASGVAALLLAAKAMFRDKLPPKWQFAIWGILGLSLIVPAGLGGRYVLFNWAMAVDALKISLTGSYGFTDVLFPFPVARLTVPRTAEEWVFAVYTAGVVLHLARYAASYIGLRRALRRGRTPDAGRMERLVKLSTLHRVPLCEVVEVPGLPSAFVCGVFRPVLALPADSDVDDKVLLHELLHLRSRDTVWSIVICVLRSIHWCNPLLVYCAKVAGNDLESRCDQRVLELLEGEERRDYGRILLSMSNDRFARTPGSTCMNNGGRNIRRRIEAIARFKLYPAGMELVSACTAIILAFPLVLGVQAAELYEGNNMTVALATARTIKCTTPAGAFDAYGKAVLEQNAVYRILCAPEQEQQALAEAVLEAQMQLTSWDTGLTAWPDKSEGYYILNIEASEDGYQGMLVVRMSHSPEGMKQKEGMMYLAIQDVRVWEENGRWVAQGLSEFSYVEAADESLYWGCSELPSYRYVGVAGQMQVEIAVQTIYTVDSTVQQSSDTSWMFGSSSYYDTTPIPDAEFSSETVFERQSITHLGTAEERSAITHVAIATLAMDGEDDTALRHQSPEYGSYTTGIFRDGADYHSCETEAGWGPELPMGGGGSRSAADLDDLSLPEGYWAELYINHEFVANMELYLREGGPK